MSESNRSGRLDHVEITIEGTEDLVVRPWLGPSVLQTFPISGDAATFPQGNFDVLIVNDEDLTVRPWPRAQATQTRIEADPGPAKPPDPGPERGVS
jgi:hypothetical protein